MNPVTATAPVSSEGQTLHGRSGAHNKVSRCRLSSVDGTPGIAYDFNINQTRLQLVPRACCNFLSRAAIAVAAAAVAAHDPITGFERAQIANAARGMFTS